MLIKLINFYLYSSLHIALCAMALTSFTYHAFEVEYDLNYVLFIGVGTMVTYGLHRIIGARKSAHFQNQGRFAVVKQYLGHIRIYTVIASVISIPLFYVLPRQKQYLLIILSLISLLYTLPVFAEGKRLRDYAFIKIFLVSLVWGASTGSIVLLGYNLASSVYICYFLSLFCYITAITLPFDIRDIKVDRELNVETIPSKIGKHKAFKISILLLLAAAAFTMCLPISYSLTGSLLVTYIISALVIYKVRREQHDYWYSGVLDATMIIPITSCFLFNL